MNKRTLLSLVLLGALLICLSSSPDLGQAQGSDRITLAIFDFKRVGEEGEEVLGKSIAEVLWRAVTNNYYEVIETVDRAEINEAVENAGITEPIDDPTTAASIAQSLRAEKAVIGTFEKLGSSYRIDAVLINSRSAEIISIRKVKSGDTSAAVIEATYKLASKLVKDILGEPVEETLGNNRDVLVNPTPGFEISIWTDRGEGGTYHIGDTLHVYFKTSEGCYLTIFDIGTSENITIILPNDYSQENLITANNEYTFPDEDDPFYYSMIGPPGEECLKAICTTEDVELTVEDYVNDTGIFSEIDTSYEDMSKDVAVVLSEESEEGDEIEWAEDSSCFLVEE